MSNTHSSALHVCMMSVYVCPAYFSYIELTLQFLLQSQLFFGGLNQQYNLHCQY